MKSSITKRWVRGSLLFTLAVVLVAEGLFLYFTITGYYKDVRRSFDNKFTQIRAQLTVQTGESASSDAKAMRLIRVVQQFDAKTQYELMLVRANGGIDTTSSGILPTTGSTLPSDIAEAIRPGSNGRGEYVGKSETGEKIMAQTILITDSAARGVVAVRLVTSLTLVDRAIRNVVVASAALFLVIILASVISGVYFIRSIVYPLRRVEATAARIAQGDFDTRITNRSNDEVGSLCETINHMAEELSKNDRMKNEFISSVSHELRTPLTSIKGWAETVDTLNNPADPNFHKGLEIIKGETDRLYNMVEELLDFSRMQDGVQLSTELLDLAAEVEDAVLLSGQRAASLGVALLYTAPEAPVPVMADKNRMRQVLVNVLDNAIKYSYTGGEVDIQVMQAGGSAFVEVVDEGQGISPEDLEYVKQKFYKGRGALRGSGIGLAVVDEIMEAHNGALEITSELNRGTQVLLQLPLHGRAEKKEQKEDGKN